MKTSHEKKNRHTSIHYSCYCDIPLEMIPPWSFRGCMLVGTVLYYRRRVIRQKRTIHVRTSVMDSARFFIACIIGVPNFEISVMQMRVLVLVFLKSFTRWSETNEVVILTWLVLNIGSKRTFDIVIFLNSFHFSLYWKRRIVMDLPSWNFILTALSSVAAPVFAASSSTDIWLCHFGEGDKVRCRLVSDQDFVGWSYSIAASSKACRTPRVDVMSNSSMWIKNRVFWMLLLLAHGRYKSIT